MKRFLRPWWIILYVLVGIRFVYTRIWGLFGWSTLWELNTTVTVNDGDSLNDVFEQVSTGMKTIGLKRFLRNNPEIIDVLQPWSYILSGSYSYEDFFVHMNDGPQVSYKSVTLLEWWSSFDMDAALARKEYINEGEYLDFVRNDLIISKYVNRYDFLALADEETGGLETLEWYLYPETYFIDISKNFIDQLVFLQLEQYNTNVRLPYQNEIRVVDSNLRAEGLDVTLDSYELLTLASIIEKEERVDKNKVKIASVFLNRLDANMRIDADISLCYGLGEPYESCTPTVIWNNVADDTNEYNTRAVAGLTPTPIANIHVSSMKALLEAEKSDNYFYLHDDTWGIHLAEDLSWHNRNKSKYID